MLPFLTLPSANREYSMLQGRYVRRLMLVEPLTCEYSTQKQKQKIRMLQINNGIVNILVL